MHTGWAIVWAFLIFVVLMAVGRLVPPASNPRSQVAEETKIYAASRIAQEARGGPSTSERTANSDTPADTATRPYSMAPDKVDTAIRDCEHCPYMIKVARGSIHRDMPDRERLGDEATEQYAGTSRLPANLVIDRDFYMSKYPVTRGEFAAFVSETGYSPPEKCWTFEKHDLALGGVGWDLSQRPHRSWRDPGFAQTDSHPVVCVSPDDALAYTDWLSQKTRRDYRLPTEREWEYAARAGGSMLPYWEGDAASACRYGNVFDVTALTKMKNMVFDSDTSLLTRMMWSGRNPRGNPSVFFDCDDGYLFTAPVDAFPPNAFGFFDMSGNVTQWTSDCMNIPAEIRSNFSSGPEDCNPRGLRGMSWGDGPRSLRVGSGARNESVPRERVLRDSEIGFRVVTT